MSEIQSVKLAHLVKFGNGQDWKSVEAQDGAFPVYGSGGKFGLASDFLHDGEVVLFGRKGTVDRPIYVNEKFWTVDTMYYAIPHRDRCSGKYLYYWATTIPFKTITTNTALPSVTSMDLSQLYVPLPPLEAQQRIADYLDRETAEIDAAVADLDRYVESMTSRMSLFVSNALNKDKHPAVPIFTFASISAGDNITAESIEESGDFPVYGGNGLRGFANLHNQQGDRVLIGRQGALCGNVHLAKGPFFASEHALVVAPHKKINLVWLEHALRDLNLRLLSQASAQPGISASEVSRQRVNLPPFEAQHAIAQRISNETERMNALIADSTRLRELLLKRRSVLITDVVTGRKQV